MRSNPSIKKKKKSDLGVSSVLASWEPLLIIPAFQVSCTLPYAVLNWVALLRVRTRDGVPFVNDLRRMFKRRTGKERGLG